MKKMIVVCLSILITGCVTWRGIYRDLEPLIGQHLDAVISLIGLPNAEQNIADTRIFLWRNASNVVIPVVNTTQVGGMIGHEDYNATATSIGYKQTTVGCVLRISVDQDMRVTRWTIHGHKNHCAAYSQRLAKLAQRSN